MWPRANYLGLEIDKREVSILTSLAQRWVRALCLVALASAAVPSFADPPSNERSLTELQNTVINLLQALVDKGLLTREQAQQLVKQAQDKATADAAAAAAAGAAQSKEDQNAVRVPYVPQIVKDEISHQVAQEVKPAVEADLARTNKMPAWLARVSVFGDVQVRGQANWYPAGNSFQQILNYNAVNAAGGQSKATYPYLNTTYNEYFLRLRARLGVKATLTDTLQAYIRLASGSLTSIAGSESQTLGQYFNRYTIGVDQAFLIWNSSTEDTLPVATVLGGRIPNPWFSPTELEFARDLTFEGIAATTRLGWGEREGEPDASHVYLTLGGFPVLMSPLQPSESKWLVGAQLGSILRFNDGDDHLHFAAAFYDYFNVTGQVNAPFSTQLNYTAPAFVQSGNTMFNIANNPGDPTVQLWALAAHFRIADLAALWEHHFERYSMAVAAQADRNYGYHLEDIEALSGQTISSPQNKGYVAELSFGDPVVERFGSWRAAAGYRHVQSDAVPDAWTDADFHQGGTNATGYYLWGAVGLAYNTWLRVRYLSGNEITGARYALDILQIDVATHF
jgi:hypothetical protein